MKAEIFMWSQHSRIGLFSKHTQYNEIWDYKFSMHIKKEPGIEEKIV